MRKRSDGSTLHSTNKVGCTGEHFSIRMPNTLPISLCTLKGAQNLCVLICSSKLMNEVYKDEYPKTCPCFAEFRFQGMSFGFLRVQCHSFDIEK